MTFVISSACIDVKDMSCVEVCPVDCIYFKEIDRMCYVEPFECIDCGVCESACPVGAIFESDSVPGDVKDFIGINALWFEDEEAARAKVEEFVQSNPSMT